MREGEEPSYIRECFSVWGGERKWVWGGQNGGRTIRDFFSLWGKGGGGLAKIGGLKSFFFRGPKRFIYLFILGGGGGGVTHPMC